MRKLIRWLRSLLVGKQLTKELPTMYAEAVARDFNYFRDRCRVSADEATELVRLIAMATGIREYGSALVDGRVDQHVSSILPQSRRPPDEEEHGTPQ